MKTFITILAAIVTIAVNAQTNTPAPDVAPPVANFDTNGLSFTNVTIQLATGYENGTGNSQSQAFVNGQYDMFHLKNFDVGAQAGVVFANTQNAMDKADIGPVIIKNLDTFQLAVPILFGRKFETAPSWYFGTGLDINYNLTKGLGILGTKSGFTYVTGGYRFEKSLSTIKDNTFEHLVRAGVGYAF